MDDLDEEHFVDAIADYACDWFQVAARVALQPASLLLYTVVWLSY